MTNRWTPRVSELLAALILSALASYFLGLMTPHYVGKNASLVAKLESARRAKFDSRAGTLQWVEGAESRSSNEMRLGAIEQQDNGSIEFQFFSTDREFTRFPIGSWWTWSDGNLEPSPRGAMVILSGGSCLAARSVEWNGTDCILQTRWADNLKIPCSLAIGIVPQPRFDLAQRLEQVARLNENALPKTRVWLPSGDWIEGELDSFSLSENQPLEAGASEATLSVATDDRTIVLEWEQVELVSFARAAEAEAASDEVTRENRWLQLSLTDGSILQLTNFEVDSQTSTIRCEIDPALKLEFAIDKLVSQVSSIRSRDRQTSSLLMQSPLQSGRVPLFAAIEPSPASNAAIETRSTIAISEGRWVGEALSMEATSSSIYTVPQGSKTLSGWLAVPDSGNSSNVVAQVFVMDAAGSWKPQASFALTLEPSAAPAWFTVDVQDAKAVAINASQPEPFPPSVKLLWLDLRWSD